MLLDVKIVFDDYLKQNFGHKPEVLQYLLSHERKALCLNNLCGQIEVAEKRSKLKLNFDKEKYKLSIEEVAKLFAHAAIKARVHELTSIAERFRRESQESKYDEIRSVVKGLDDDDDEAGETPRG